MTDTAHLPLSLSHLSACSLQLFSRFFRLLFFFFKYHTPLSCLSISLIHSHTHTYPPTFFPSLSFRDMKWKYVSFTTKVETHPHRHLSLLLLRHGVNTNEEEMSPRLCPHLSLQTKGHAHLSPAFCLYISHLLFLALSQSEFPQTEIENNFITEGGYCSREIEPFEFGAQRFGLYSCILKGWPSISMKELSCQGVRKNSAATYLML